MAHRTRWQESEVCVSSSDLLKRSGSGGCDWLDLPQVSPCDTRFGYLAFASLFDYYRHY